MRVATPCPDLRHYQSLFSGQLAVADKEALLQHLEGCDSCVQKLQSLPGQDTLIEWIKQARTVAAPPVEQQLAALMQRMIQLVPPAAGASVSAMGSIVTSKAALPAGALTFSCGSCKKPLRVKQEAAGKKVKCPHCKQVVQAPTAPPAAKPGAMETAILPPAQTSETATVANLPASSKERELCSFLSPSQAPDEIGRLGSYRVLKVLGAGGMGVVFRAEDPQLQRLVALKAMLPALAANDSARQRFLREARAAASLKHDHIVTIHQVGEDGGAPFLAMEFLEGEALEDRIKREGKLPLTEVLRIGREIADGLQAAHEHGLIHRDIKPANVWLEGKRGRVKILDFGLARFSGDEVHLTQSGAIVGTPAYMPPEQARGESVDSRCDLYSLGCVLYRLCTGELPFKGDNTMSLLLALATEQPKSPREINADVPPPLADLILRLLAKEPAQRPATAGDVAQALQDIAVEKAPTPAAARTPAPPRRRRKLLWAAAAGAFLIAAMLTVIVIHLGKPEEGTVTIETVDPDVKLIFTSGGKVITVYDQKTGKEIKLPLGSYEVSVQGGKQGLKLETKQFTLKRGEQPLVKVTWQPPEKRDAPRANLSPPVQISEPPPLAEWLKGRKILTVSKDGKGQFKTIQAALEALKPHEAIKVLDRGPYHERLELSGVPQDTGLISDVQTVVDCQLKRGGWKEGEADFYKGHYFQDTDGFRVSGFHFILPSVDEMAKLPGGFIGQGIRVNRPGGFVFENCKIQEPDNSANWFSLFLGYFEGVSTETACVRDCIIEGRLGVASENKDASASVLIEHNYVKNSGRGTCLLMLNGPGGYGNVTIRHNILDGAAWTALFMTGFKHVKTLDVHNNILRPSAQCSPAYVEKVPRGAFRFHNNLSLRAGLLVTESGKEKQHTETSFQTWQVGHNSYPRLFAAHETDKLQFPKGPGDVVGRVELLSYDPKNADYLRIPADSPLAKGGAGGAWPSYIGALPPGPAPKDGDWFTRLRQRWDNLAPAAKPMSGPVQIPEPPPLAEWLKGRKILTVSHDGKGQFKTIQAALEALKPNQVVKVLDRGPYRECLNLENVPADSGLVSEQGTLLEFPGNWRKVGVEKDLFRGHYLANTAGFRFHGFCFTFPEKKGNFGGLWVDQPNGFVLENCCFHTASNRFRFFRDEQQFAVSLYASQIEFARPVVVRQCLFDSCLVFHTHTTDAARRSTDFVLENNYFAKSQGCTADGDYRKIIVRNNVLDQETVLNLWDQKHATLVEVSNNTVLGDVFFQSSAPRGTVSLCNNLLTGRQSFDLSLGAEKALAEASKSWQSHHNVFHGRVGSTLLPLGATDRLAAISFLSQEPDDANYLRLPADSPLAKAGAGGAWPSYIGALPPGPAPKDGDWFTRLREKWRKDKPAAIKKP